MTSSLDQRDQMLAAEYALGALEGALLKEAQKRYDDDASFRHEVDGWSEHFQPLLDEVIPQEPSPHIFAAIENRLGFDAKAEGSWLDWLQNKFMVAGLAFGLFVMAATVSFNLMPVFFAPNAPLLTAALTEEGQQISARVENNNRDVVLVADLPALENQDRELWLIIESSPTPISLGVMQAKGETRLSVDETIVPLFAEGAVLAITLEPIGGSPSGLPTGPVVASAPLILS